MDSGMLNAFHEDPFDGNFAKYETEPNFWTANDDELQLSNTLNGILPIAPTDVSLLSGHHEDDDGEGDERNSKNLLIFSDYIDQETAYDRQLSAMVEYERNDVGNDDDDAQSQCSNSTFRTRTDSSSIGDYESHSSDYDDEDDDDIGDHNDPDGQRKNRTLSTNTITSESDAFGLNIDVNNFDLAEFITKDDFAENLNTIRIKDQKIQAPEVSVAPSPGAAEISVTVPVPIAVPVDDDTDSIIDVETVDVIDGDESMWRAKKQTAAPEDLRYVDNVKSDPSWSPKLSTSKKTITTVGHKETKLVQDNQHKTATTAVSTAKPKSSNNICLVPSKKQCDFLKRKVNSRSSKLVAATKKGPEAAKSGINKQPNSTPAPAPCTLVTGLGLNGKNLALLKHEKEAAAMETVQPEQTSKVPPPKRKLNLEEYKQRRSGGVLGAKPKIATVTTSSSTPAKQARIETVAAATVPTAKPLVQPRAQPSPQKLAIVSIVNSLKCPDKAPVSDVPMDPITIAKNKVLRMLEMKRAQQLKIIDSRVSAKVPRVTKLPPLKDIVKDTYCMVQEQEEETEAQAKLASSSSSIKTNNSLHPDYEEIIIVSVGCNTEITIPPNQMSRTSPRSLLKSSVLLYNISNSQDAHKNINNSLIASIQSEVVKQTSCTALAKPTASEPVSELESKQHGEDMVIMHLPKDRVRKPLSSMSTQTDLQPEFPLLTPLYSKRQSRQRHRKNRNYRQVVSQSGSDGSSGSRDSSSSSSSSLESYRTRSRSHSRSRSNSLEQLRNSDTLALNSNCGNSSIGHGGYSSRSTHRHRSSVSSSSNSEAGKYERRQRRTSYNKRRLKNPKTLSGNFSSSGSDVSDRERSRSPHRACSRARSNNNNSRRAFVDRNVSQPAVEERRIVYVGRIEAETTKEMLRRKFLTYGSVKQITIHYKENGMKYGFVTYERAQDAFTAIDTSARDPQINMYDISFGGRRAFCRASYADLDNAGMDNYQSYVYPKAAPAPKPQEDSFEALLLKVKAKLNAAKPGAADAPHSEQSGAATTTASIPPDHKNQI